MGFAKGSNPSTGFQLTSAIQAPSRHQRVGRSLGTGRLRAMNSGGPAAILRGAPRWPIGWGVCSYGGRPKAGSARHGCRPDDRGRIERARGTARWIGYSGEHIASAAPWSLPTTQCCWRVIRKRLVCRNGCAAADSKGGRWTDCRPWPLRSNLAQLMLHATGKHGHSGLTRDLVVTSVRPRSLPGTSRGRCGHC